MTSNVSDAYDNRKSITKENSLSDLNKNPKNKTKSPPAIQVPLTGKYLIEASAGTGKTWTLTGIILRLLIEARRAPEQIIATTFTRAAAAEMRERVHERLVNFYQLLQWVESLQANVANHTELYPEALRINLSENKSQKRSSEPENKTDAKAKHSRAELNAIRKRRETWLIQQAQVPRFDEIMQDPINLYLVTYLLDHVQTYMLNDAIRRTALVLTTLDKLFIGTLDSLAQKWLAEYSSETGHQQNMAIIEDVDITHVTHNIIHDELRQFQSRMYHNNPKIYDLLEQQGKLTAITDHAQSVDKALNFISAEIDNIKMPPPFDFAEYEALLSTFAHSDLSDIAPYFNEDYRKAQGFSAKASIQTRFAFILEIQQKINQYHVSFKSYLSEDALKLFDALKAAQYLNDKGKITGFKTKHEKQHQTFFAMASINTLMAIYDATEDLDRYLLAVLAQLNRHIALTVRQKMPLILEERGETTFTLQMVRLNQALTGKQGNKLARYIRHHYPVALIDESQDVNGEQALMVEQIYLPKKQPNQPDPLTGSLKEDKGFLLLVGDPKQAIYGFRGGDVANYNAMKRRFNSNAIMTLNENRRSNARLIDALNHWFGMPEVSTTNNALSELGEDIHYQYITAVNQTAKLSWLTNTPSSTANDVVANQTNNTSTASFIDTVNDILPDKTISTIHLPYDKEAKYDEYETAAFHIAALLKSGHTLDGNPIKPSDIGVLGRARRELKQVEDMLVKLKVPTLATSDISIFETIIAADIAALMAAMLHPYRRDMINRVLTSHLYGLSLAEVKAMMVSHDTGVADGDSQTDITNNHNDKAKQNEGVQTKSYQDFITYLKQGALQWQQWGILSALHFLLDTNLIQPQGVWQALASHPEGERHIMDLRHIMDILAQYGMGMGEHELLTWFQQNMDTASTSDWAKQQPLPTESGVQLMTIHKAKGLEFPIVYVLGMDKSSRQAGLREDFGMYLYNGNGNHSDKGNAEQQKSNNKINPSQINSSHVNPSQRRLSPVKGITSNDTYFTDKVTRENFAELKRLGYVAFTRASEQLYIVLQDPKNKAGFERQPVFHWFEAIEATFALPNRLTSKIGCLEGAKIGAFYDTHKQILKSPNVVHPQAQNRKSTQDDASAQLTKQTIKIEYPALKTIMPNTYFYGWAKTSFTALARQLDDSAQAIAVVDERVDDDLQIDTSYRVADYRDEPTFTQLENIDNADDLLNLTDTKPETDIRFSFVRGANAGTFLHEVFEKIDFNAKSQWSSVIDRAVSSYQLPLMYASASHQARLLETDTLQGVTPKSYSTENDKIDIDDAKYNALVNWIDEVLYTPLLASKKALKDIPATKRFAELSFNMGLSESFKPQDINYLFKTYLPDDPDKHINLSSQDSTHLYRYLRGEIDLVYEYDGKFYVVDYKSNHLGNSLNDYDQTTLNTAMNKAGYWLQAAIYQVALHRFLSMRIKDYVGNEEKYLGAVEYVFLRGTYDSSIAYDQGIENQEQNKPIEINKPNDGCTFGLVTWDIPMDFLKALDDCFGKPE